MYIVLGASGQVGSAIADHLLQAGERVRAVVRNEQKAAALKEKGAEVAIADIDDADALAHAVQGGGTLFVLTPESGKEQDVIGDMKAKLRHYRRAVEHSGIEKIVGLSSIGAQFGSGTGNLQLSYLLEHAFLGLPQQQVFVRPAYYFSNWMGYLDSVKNEGALPSLYPPELVISMIAPADVARQVARIMIEEETEAHKVYELEGPERYSSRDVAEAFGQVLNKEVSVAQIPRSQWEETFRQLGFSPDGIRNFIEMAEAVISGKAHAEGGSTIRLKGTTTLQEYLERVLKTKD